MPKLAKNLIFCVHAHQPVGNFDAVFESAYQKCYHPFFEVLEKHPTLSLVCHFSGSLIDWLEQNKPQFIEKLRRMSSHGQIEFLGGGYYEPIYGAIPRRDLAGQIDKMRGKIEDVFGQSPKGAWLTERVWDPDLVKPLKQSNVEYTVVDDFHLGRAGVPAPVTGYYRVTESDDWLDLFVSMKELRYLMPFGKAQEALGFVHSLPGGPQETVVFADDLEKFGMWPGTYSWVYQEGWLDKFFTLVENDSSVTLSTFEKARNHFGPKATVQIPHASYAEMMEWSGGRFYNFFDKYPESRYMRDRMWSLSHRLEAKVLENGHGHSAQEALYRAQCNCAYWHGVFGGLYLHHLRSAIFENLIKAELLMENGHANSAAASWPQVETEVLDSGERFRIRQRDVLSFFNANYGATLEELDYLPKTFNLMCNLKRQPEPYHQLLLAKGRRKKIQGALSIHQMLGIKERGLEKNLLYDSAERLSLMDHFFEREVSLEAWQKLEALEKGDFIGSPYEVTFDRGQQSVQFKRSGTVKNGEQKKALCLTKNIFPEGPATLKICYQLRNESKDVLGFVFGVGFNFSIGESRIQKGISETGLREWVLHDQWRGVSIYLTSQDPMSFLGVPVETVSESESGLEKTFQGISILLQQSFTLEPEQTKEQILRIRLDSTDGHQEKN